MWRTVAPRPADGDTLSARLRRLWPFDQPGDDPMDSHGYMLPKPGLSADTGTGEYGERTMGDSPAAAASAPDAVFAADDDLPTLWIKAYQGEVSGELLFTGMAERADNLSHRQKLNVLALLERRTREALVPVMERSGLPTDPDPQTVADTKTITDMAASMSWVDLWASGESIITQFLALYRRIGELAETEQEAAALLVAHEEALRDFAETNVLAGATTR